jgi:hypothetical protein
VCHRLLRVLLLRLGTLGKMWSLLGIVSATLLVPVVVLVLGVEASVWPSSWTSEQEAALIVALLGAVIPLYGAGAKAIYDEVAAIQANTRQIQQLLFDGYEEYSRALIYPLLAASGDLLTCLRWDLKAPTRETRDQVLYQLSRYTECVSHLRMRYTRVPNPLPQRGLFLSSSSIEEIVWSLIVEPWAFGVPGTAGESIAVASIRDREGRLLPIGEFGKETSPEDLSYFSNAVMRVLEEDHVRVLLADTLFALNSVLDWAVMMVLKPWYRSVPAFPRDVLKPLTATPDDIRNRIGLNIPDVSRL